MDKILKKKLNELGSFPFVFIMIGLAIFFWINGPAFFYNWDIGNSSTIIAYLLMMTVFITWAKKDTREHLKIPLKKAIPGLFLGISITFIIMNSAFYFGVMEIPTFPPEMFWPTIIIQFCMVATAEEIIFRGVLLEYTGILISSLLFAFWHSYAYSFIWYEGGWSTLNWGAMIFAFAIGVFLAIIIKESEDLTKEHKITLGLPATIGIHATYNLCVMGAFYLGT